MRSLTISVGMDALIKLLVTPISERRHYHNGYIFSRKRVWNSLHQRTVEGSQDIVLRDDARLGFSWLISWWQGSLRISLAFLNIIVVPLRHGSSNKDFTFNICHLLLHPGARTTIQKPGVFLFTISSHGANLFNSFYAYLFYYKSSVAFFMTTPSPSVLWLSRSTKKGRNFNPSTVIGSGKINFIAKMWRGFWGVCEHGAAFIS